MRNMKKTFTLLSFTLFCISAFAQPTIVEPKDKAISGNLLFTGNFTLAYNTQDDLSLNKIQRNNKEITIENRITKKGLEESTQTIVLNATTFETIRESYKDENSAYNLQYGAKVKGENTNYETNEKVNVNATITGNHFHILTLPYLISTLPINLSYRVTFPVLRLNSSWQPTYLRYKITDVEETKNFSCFSGNHDNWKVTVKEKTTNHTLVIYFDKSTRRIYRIEQSFDGLHLSHNTSILVDKESDINPIRATFNYTEAMSMLSSGTSTIKGQASTRIAEKRITGNKTQYAPKGSLVALIPNTAYFKEWVNFNLSIGNISRPLYWEGKLIEGCSYPLPDEVKKAMRYTEVTDNKGNFTFENLKQGEYLVFIGFVANKYTHTTRTPTGNYNITVNGDGTSGSLTQIIDVQNWMSPQDILNHQIVKITKEEETINVKLK